MAIKKKIIILDPGGLGSGSGSKHWLFPICVKKFHNEETSVKIFFKGLIQDLLKFLKGSV